ncbi:MAG: hypothetical protein QXE79_01355 [Candidatus Bathyarchaeia archaeon]
MSERAVLYRDADGTIYDVELPLTSNVDLDEVRDELGLPSYVDLEYFPMRNAVVTIWASLNAPEIHRLHPDIFEKKICDKPIQPLLFGGAAVKVLCRSANKKGLLSRNVKDTDYIVPKKQGWRFYKLLLNLDKAFGTHFKSFATMNDRRFNGWRHGERYRVTTINGVLDNGSPTITVMDILCDAINLRHKIDVRDAFHRYRDNIYTIGLEYMLLSKAQFINEISREDLEKLKEADQDYRVLPYPYYNRDRVIIGMEEKDFRDVCAIFLDHHVGKGPSEINPQVMSRILDKDKKLALTVILNLRNLGEKSHVVAEWIGGSAASTVADGVNELLKYMPKVDKRWDKPWWNTAVETPLIE